jgi:RNA-binding protein 39
MSAAFFPPAIGEAAHVSASSSGSRNDRAHSSRDRSRERSSGGERRSRDRSDRDRKRPSSRSRSRSRSRSHRPSSYHERPTSGAGSSGASKQRGECTIFLSGLHPTVEDMDLFEFFSHVGRVEDIQLIKDPRTGKSKGLCYVEYSRKEEAEKSLVLNGQLIGGYPITIALATTQVQSAWGSSKKSIQQTPPDGIRIYVGSLMFTITESDLRPIFEAFGPLTSVEIHRDPSTQQSKGFGFISFQNREDGETALAALDGFSLAGRPMKVGYANPTDQANSAKAKAGLPSTTTGSGSSGMILPPGFGQPSVAAVHPYASAPVSAPVLPSLPPLSSSQLLPSPCILIQGMFNPAEETDPNWHVELEEDVRDECNKHGRVVAVKIDRVSPAGLVWLQYDTTESAVVAQKQLHGRWFAQKQLTAEFVPEAVFQQQAL